ncbi:MAG: aminoacyl-tRNA hydrolase [Elusimicrobiota bacterium]
MPDRYDYCLIGLGNPGSQYARTRHNAGFQLIDHVGLNNPCRKPSLSERLRRLAECWQFDIQDKSVLLAKPLTFMNNSGAAVAGLASELEVNEGQRLFVAYDDLDIPLGTVRLRPNGSAGTHRGMASIIQALGHGNFPRIRLGIGPKPPLMKSEDFVLAQFTATERPTVEDMIKKADTLWQAVVEHGLALAISKYHG